jgi:hypothetical protein
MDYYCERNADYKIEIVLLRRPGPPACLCSGSSTYNRRKSSGKRNERIKIIDKVLDRFIISYPQYELNQEGFF